MKIAAATKDAHRTCSEEQFWVHQDSATPAVFLRDGLIEPPRRRVLELWPDTRTAERGPGQPPAVSNETRFIERRESLSSAVVVLRLCHRSACALSATDQGAHQLRIHPNSTP